MSALSCDGIKSLGFKQSPNTLVVILLSLQRKLPCCLSAYVGGNNAKAFLSQLCRSETGH